MAQFIDGEVRSSTSEDDGRVVHSASVGHFTFLVVLDRGLNFVSITSNSSGPAAPPETVASIADLDAASPIFGEGHMLDEVRIWHFLGSPDIEVTHRLEGFSEAEAATLNDTAVEAAGWTLLESRGLYNEYDKRRFLSSSFAAASPTCSPSMRLASTSASLDRSQKFVPEGLPPIDIGGRSKFGVLDRDGDSVLTLCCQ